jgi:hypothetical protein
MKMLAIATLGLVLTGASASTMAAKQDRQNLAQCKSDIASVFGDDTRMKLQGVKRSRVGAKMKIHAVPTDGESQLVICWVDKEGNTNLNDRQGVAMAIPAYGEGVETVSLSN